ncbi:hypothetical protein Lrub_0687 [Legionella rubrilucens]|uniref:DUF4276 domain-containing protein n=1 Tax=Legionella rubrilucens TaxID=458 RepID=A0A0W0XZ52_9GAMM|nr:DUF4276 family protein [Legionella rubrilucens]KTD49588.1 hypothetical protein Lrub_0687 [Legionella rubrilucens]
MIRLHIICEGQTELQFVQTILSPGISSTSLYIYPAKIGVPGHKGGNVNFQRLLTDLSIRLKGDGECFCTTMLDYYALPNDFPGINESMKIHSIKEKAGVIRSALVKEIIKKLNSNIAQRFIPYIQFHEFEGLLFSQPEKIAEIFNVPATDQRIRTQLNEIRQDFESPEHINNSPHSAPSKRLEALFPQYQKTLHSIRAASEIGLATIRENCELFNNWVIELENLEQSILK